MENDLLVFGKACGHDTFSRLLYREESKNFLDYIYSGMKGETICKLD